MAPAHPTGRPAFCPSAILHVPASQRCGAAPIDKGHAPLQEMLTVGVCLGVEPVGSVGAQPSNNSSKVRGPCQGARSPRARSGGCVGPFGMMTVRHRPLCRHDRGPGAELLGPHDHPSRVRRTDEPIRLDSRQSFPFRANPLAPASDARSGPPPQYICSLSLHSANHPACESVERRSGERASADHDLGHPIQR